MLKVFISMSVIVTGLLALTWLASLLSGAMWAIISVAVLGVILWAGIKYGQEQKGNW
jgi:hypothetical protein